MEKLLIICYEYKKNKSKNANAICLNRIIDKLSDNFIVNIITTTDENSIYTELNNEVNIIYVPFGRKESHRANFRIWSKNIMNYLKTWDMNTCSRLLSISFPFQAQMVGLEIKNKYKHIKWSVYELDPYAYNQILRSNLLIFTIKLFREFMVFLKCDAILLTHELFSTYGRSYYKTFRDKFIDVGIPVMEIIRENYEIKEQKDVLDLVYVGSFYKKYREPDYMLRVMSQIENIRLHIYGTEMGRLPKEYVSSFDGRIYAYGRVPMDRIPKIINDADVLINVGNNVNNQLPSKVLEYIGTGKLIISFYGIDDDTSKMYLERYPNAALINQKNDIEENIKIVEDRIKNIKKLDKRQLKEIFFDETKDASAQKIISSL